MKLFQGQETVLAVSDMQAPFQHPDTLPFLKAVKIRYKPTKVVGIGDSLDMHTLGRFVHDPDGYGASEEYERGMVFMREFYKMFPVGIEAVSNHNGRYIKRAKEAGIPSQFLKTYDEIMQFPSGWSAAEYIEIDNVMYEHGTRFGGLNAPRQAVQVNAQSTVFGHLHSGGGITYVANRKSMFFGMNVGCLIDHDRYAFEYARDAKHRPTLGTGVVTRGVPHFVPMFIDEIGRWVGDL